MVSANLDLVRSIFSAWEHGDFSSTEWAHPEIEFVVLDGPTRARGTGLAAMAKSTRDYLGAWSDARLLADEYRELDAGRVLVLVRQGGRGKTSGLDLGQMEAERTSVFHIHDGKVTRLVLYWDREHALADLGLPPEPDSPDS
jgi:ketosteroid isomerase-like protein